MQRHTYELVQGTPEWHQFRAHHHGASEASAMLGISPYKTRTDLLFEKKTGVVIEVGDAVQRIFSRGHEIEALARPMAESLIGEDLFPVTMSYGNLSASCDGLTFDESIAWECKSLNKADFETVKNGELPKKHWPQCQQVMFVTGAEKLLFTISDGTEEGTAHVWVYADAELQQRIVDGWDQFNRDLENFEPEPEVIPAKAEPVMALPSLSIQVGGSISIQSNLDRFGERLKSFIEETNAKPETDQDFANLEQACKVLKDAEDALKQAEGNALAQTASIDEMRRTVSYLADIARTNRLTFEKLVKSEKENRKTQIVACARNDLFEHDKSIQAELPFNFMRPVVNFADAIKGKKTLSSMQDAVNAMLSNAKIESDALARELREKHTWYIENAGEYSFLFSDLAQIIYKPYPDFRAIAENRITQHKEQERIKAEAAEKAQAEREERIRKEAEEKARRDEQQRIASEQAERERLERENQEELGRTTQKTNKEKTNTEVAKNTHFEQMPVFNEEIQSVVADKSVSKPPIPSRESLILTIAGCYEVDFETSEQWLISVFSIESVSKAA